MEANKQGIVAALIVTTVLFGTILESLYYSIGRLSIGEKRPVDGVNSATRLPGEREQILYCLVSFSNWACEHLRKDGKASRAESLLMKQMLIHSIIILFFNLFRFLAPSLVSGLFGGNLGYIASNSFPFQGFLAELVGSILCAFLLRKRPENKSEERATKETTTNTSREAFSKRKQPIRSH
ncbi:unnamed protein product, partial [Mesorhabditis belari]|uniref:Transmembrane protein n=1 Tax=Mesorhabditis belari TaxID=2138241 RepID=A0AAF3F6C3_9BILA